MDINALKPSLRIIFICLYAVISIISGCSDGKDSGFELESELVGCAETSSCAPNPSLQLGLERPAQVQIPSNYTTSTLYPLIIVLHGYGFNGEAETIYLGLDTLVDDKQYILVKPDGTANANGVRFWNGTPACCAETAENDDNAGIDYNLVDDVSYIRSLIEQAAATYSIDTNRIGLFGHSNGGFMTLRMACEASELITSVISLAGSTFADAKNCAPATYPVNVLLLHGDADQTIFYQGGTNSGNPYPGALETAKRFAQLAGCDSDNAITLENRDIDGSITGSETEVLSYPGCSEDVDIELWTIVGGPHIPFPWTADAREAFVDWLTQRG